MLEGGSGVWERVLWAEEVEKVGQGESMGRVARRG